ncbi:MAG: energy transducer TonB [Gammaproteobacteria bacterium]
MHSDRKRQVLCRLVRGVTLQIRLKNLAGFYMRATVLTRVLPAAGLLGMVLLAACTTPTAPNAPLKPEVRIFPNYPPEAAIKHVQGSVLVCFTVKPDGSVYKPYIKSASSKEVKKYLGKALLDVMPEWKFSPKRVDGKPVTSSNICQTMRFRIHH